MRYPIAIETGDSRHAYGVVVPDLPGCFSAGDTLDDALTHAQEAILLHLEGLLDEGQPVPEPSDIERLRRKREFRNWTWAVVDVDLSQLGDDAHARRHGETRSGFLARAALDAMRKQAKRA
ncbi:MAG: type II toxin-antitoxin system HicB family antitoxin [Gammaproteobacteria bacterium]|nr:MAG: type II toxin-antitoxin system HicB family antitoxin [Gammaproteobacteria bacterium]